MTEEIRITCPFCLEEFETGEEHTWQNEEEFHYIKFRKDTQSYYGGIDLVHKSHEADFDVIGITSYSDRTDCFIDIGDSSSDFSCQKHLDKSFISK